MDSKDSKTNGQDGGQPSRREFLTRAGLMAGGMALFGLPAFRPQPTAAAVLDQRGYSTATYALELDGMLIDTLRTADGGFPKADVILEPPGATGPFVRKHIGNLKYQDIVMQCDPDMPKPLFDWING